MLKWNESLSVGVTEIDQQHQKLISMINELGDAMKQRKGTIVVGNIIDGLVAYTKTHFKTEEKYFDRFKYPAADGHKKQHVDFVQKVSNFKDGFEKGKLSLTIEVLNFLNDWLQKHIKVSDKQYSQLFNENGLK